MKYKIISVRKSLVAPKDPVSVSVGFGGESQSWDESGRRLARMVGRDPKLYKFLGTDMVIRDSGTSITIYRVVPSDFEIEES